MRFIQRQCSAHFNTTNTHGFPSILKELRTERSVFSSVQVWVPCK
uniref:Uncharacterized protein n=1 Tax=Anguilla anguilla TaxID=7936 RepID=A0A0E9URJ1_ANGAN